MKQVETIVWIPYPENKPDPNVMDRYYLLYNNQPYVDWWMLSNGGHWEKTSKLDNDLITHIAKCPPVYPEAKTFNFQTAWLLMKEGKTVKQGDNYFHINNGYIEKRYWDGNACMYVWEQYEFGFPEIEGEWRLAE